jgi:polyhydroxyalkanoate synthesis repressor PhaR
MVDGKIRFKKYANRRLYDMEKSRHVTLTQVAALIRQGHQVEVVDAKTKEDVTAFILTQILLEESKQKNVLLPVPLLHLIIQYGDNILGEFFEKYLQQTIQAYIQHKATVEDQFKQWLSLGMGTTDLAQKAMSGLNPLQSFFDRFASKKESKNEKE